MIEHQFEPEPFERDACDRKFDDNGRAGYCGKPKAEHLAAPVETPKAEPKKWPRRVGWKKLQERKAKCRHRLDFGVMAVRFDSPGECPTCLWDELQYWKARSRSAEGNAAMETVRALRLEAAIAVERSRVGTPEAVEAQLR